MMVVNNTFDTIRVVASGHDGERDIEPQAWNYIRPTKASDAYAVVCSKGSCIFSCASPLGGITYHIFGDLKLRDNTTVDGSVVFY